KKMIKYGIEKSDAVTAVSKDLVEQTKRKIHTERDISVIYNFVDEDEYTKRDMTSIRNQYGILPEDKVVIHISNFRKVKRIEDVINTFKNINNNVQSKLLLV